MILAVPAAFGVTVPSLATVTIPSGYTVNLYVNPLMGFPLASLAIILRFCVALGLAISSLIELADKVMSVFVFASLL